MVILTSVWLVLASGVEIAGHHVAIFVKVWNVLNFHMLAVFYSAQILVRT
eukprot:Gb_27888 [translate_table: standard]